MRNYKNISVSWFKNCKTKTSYKTINIWLWLLKKPDCIQIINQIRSSTDKEIIRQLKEKLPVVTISGIFSEKRTSDTLQKHSGLICIDIDGKDNSDITDMEELKQNLLELPYVLYCGLSASGKGVFCIIPITDPDKHTQHFFSLEKDFQEMGITVDTSCKDVTRLRMCSYDPNPVINLQAAVYEQYIEASCNARTPRKTQKKFTAHDAPNVASIQHKEEKVLSMEDYFLQPMVDVNSNRPIQVVTKNAKQKTQDFVAYIVGEGIDITAFRDDWIDICIVITSNFGEEGRQLFQAISQFYTYKPYSKEVCDEKYDEILSCGYRKPVSRLYEIAAKYGL